MPRPTRRQLLIALTLGLLLAVVAIVIAGRNGLRSRLDNIQIGMTRSEVEAILGPPTLVLPRINGGGHASVWVDQFWQVDVITGPTGHVEKLSCAHSNSAFHRTLGRFL